MRPPAHSNLHQQLQHDNGPIPPRLASAAVTLQIVPLAVLPTSEASLRRKAMTAVQAKAVPNRPNPIPVPVETRMDPTTRLMAWEKQGVMSSSLL